MNRLARQLPLLVLALIAVAPPAGAQAPLPLERELRVYLDCTDFRCDDDYFIEEIEWVDFVRDRQVADVHVLITEQSTGAGGSEYTLEFIGRDVFEGRSTRMVHVDPPDATEDNRRGALARMLRIGLAPFAMSTASAAMLDVAVAERGEGDPATSPVDDPWNHWVFNTNVRTFVQGESMQNFLNLNYSASASRITSEWKHSFSANGSLNRNYFEIEELDSTGAVVFADTFVSNQRSYGLNALNVKSLNDHWSVGARTSWRRSDFTNQQANVRLMPAVEYSVYPYAESTRRQFTFTYVIGPSYVDYEERTIYDRMHETLLQHQLIGSYDATQPWGSIDLTVAGSHYIAHLDDGPEWKEAQYSIATFAEFDIRIIEGLSFNAFGGVDWIRDQIYLAAGGQSEREILLRQRQLATSYEYFAQVGLRYTFGSIYSPVVNPRLDEL